MSDQRPKKITAVEDQSHRRRKNLRIFSALVFLSAAIIFHSQIGEMWRYSIAPLISADWQGQPKETTVNGSAPGISDITEYGDETERAASESTSKMVTVALNSGFEPVIFEMSAASIPLQQAEDQPFFPAVLGESRYGTFEFANGGQYRFELKDVGPETLLNVDLNGDGDFTNDGEAYRSPTDAFEVTVSFAMENVTGRTRPAGEYLLWLYRTPEGGLQQVALTQLVGNVYLGGRGFKAYVVENSSIDGNYANEGIYVDWDRDGRIHPGKEFVPQGGNLAIGDDSYAFVIRR